jgi:hypothetical protein
LRIVAAAACRLEVVSSWKLESSRTYSSQRIQQHQRRQADIAANADVHARRFRHFAHQGGDGAFTVRTGNRDNRRLRFAAEQLDIANDLNARICRSAQRRMRQRDTRAGDNQIGRQQPVIIQTTNMAFNLFRQLIQPGGATRVSITRGVTPRAMKKSTHDRPVRPSPIMTTFLP